MQTILKNAQQKIAHLYSNMSTTQYYSSPIKQ